MFNVRSPKGNVTMTKATLERGRLWDAGAGPSTVPRLSAARTEQGRCEPAVWVTESTFTDTRCVFIVVD